MRRKILIITKHLRVGGTEKMLLRILKQWLSLNYEIDIVLLYNSVTLRDDVLMRCHITSIFPEKSPQAKQLVKSDPGSIYRSKIHKLYDIEIAFQEGLPTKLVANSPNRLSYKIAWVHTYFLQYHFSASAYNSLEEEAKIYKKYNKVVFCSSSAQTAWNHVLLMPDVSEEVIYSPLDSDSPSRIRQEDPLLPPTFLTLSRLSPQKGLIRLLEASALLKQRTTKYRVLIVGDGELYHELTAQANTLGLEKNVVFSPATQHPFTYLTKCIAYINTSYTESFGLSMQEALYAEVPVIAMDTLGAVEVLQNGRFGCIIPQDPEKLCDAMERVLIDSTYLKSLCSKATRGHRFWINQSIQSRTQLHDLLTRSADQSNNSYP